MVKVVKCESIIGNTTQFVVPEEEVTIGRGFLQCDDTSLWRNHGLIRTELEAGENSLFKSDKE